ncbi:hypothetical protein ABID26_004759 [Mesorhizobium shonense]|uniref:Uncharacterized protein n=1 Tax=Mesorhizobium shonense TaxID=1209948 RepID=A0ABV2HXH4_9HYPH
MMAARSGVGRDNISDFTTNLIKDYLCRYTEKFAAEHLLPDAVRDCHLFGFRRGKGDGKQPP